MGLLFCERTPCSLLTTIAVDYKTDEDVVLILELQCFTMFSPSGSVFILLQDYSDSSMQICFIY